MTEDKIIIPSSYALAKRELMIESFYDPYSESTKYRCVFCKETGELKDKDAANALAINFNHECNPKKIEDQINEERKRLHPS